MGFLDNVTSAVNRGTAAAGRASRSTQLKMQQSDLLKQRRDLCGQLGASLYDTARNMPELYQGREALFDAIASIDAQRSAIDAEIQQLEAEAAASQIAYANYRCPRCGANVVGTDLFCGGCGLPIAEVMAGYQQPQQPAAPTGPACPSCGAPVNPGDAFCMSCGTRIEA